jgi:uncharacterized protein
VNVRFHVPDSLRVFTRRDDEGPRCVRFRGRRSVKDLVESVGIPHCEVGEVTIDGVPTALDAVLDGDERRFRAHLRIAPIAHPPDASVTFALDGHLGRLCAYLRALGFDTTLRGGEPEDEFVARAVAGDRVVLSRDVGLLKLAAVRRGSFVRATDPSAQVAEVVDRFSLRGRASPFSRCMGCNGPLVDVSRDDVAGRVPERVLARHSEFRRCGVCARLFWRGTHHTRLTALLAPCVNPAPRGIHS